MLVIRVVVTAVVFDQRGYALLDLHAASGQRIRAAYERGVFEPDYVLVLNVAGKDAAPLIHGEMDHFIVDFTLGVVG